MVGGIIDALHESIIDPDFGVSCVPYDAFKELLPALPYGSVLRVMTLMLAYTGMRESELDKCYVNNLCGNTFYWCLGKNQTNKRPRKEVLPECYVQELAYYRQTNRVSQDKLFGVSAETYRRYFNKHREIVGGAWKEKERLPTRRENYVLLIKSFRKNFQTIIFAYYYQKYGDAGVALEFTAKRMRHSSKNITAYHYIENFEKVQVEKWLEHFFCYKPRSESQRLLLDYES